MRLFRSVVVGTLFSVMSVLPAFADIKVVVSIKPIHSLVSGVMAGVGVPSLIVEGAGSPHTYALKPSQARALQDADVVFWVGAALETFLEKPLESLGANAGIEALMDIPGLKQLPFREDGPGHDADEESHAKHEDAHENAHEDEHKHEAGHKDAHEDEHEDEHHHDHGEFDPHVWLDAENAKQMVRHISMTLVKTDPANAEVYRANTVAVLKRLDALDVQMTARLAPVADQPFVVFHDSYQYLEERFDLMAVGSITVVPDVMPGAERVGEILHRIHELKAVCIFAEPQFTSKLVQVIAQEGGVRTSVLDPLGAGIPAGPEQYFSLMGKLTDSMVECLGAPA